PSNVGAHELDLAGMDPRTDLETDPWHRPDNRHGASHRPGGAVEDGKESVAGGVDLATPESTQFITDKSVMPLEQLLPGSVADGVRRRVTWARPGAGTPPIPSPDRSGGHSPPSTPGGVPRGIRPAGAATRTCRRERWPWSVRDGRRRTASPWGPPGRVRRSPP